MTSYFGNNEILSLPSILPIHQHEVLGSSLICMYKNLKLLMNLEHKNLIDTSENQKH